MPSGKCSKERAKDSKERAKAKVPSKDQKASKAKRKEMSRASKAKEKGSSKAIKVAKVSSMLNRAIRARASVKEDQSRTKENLVNIAVEPITDQINAGGTSQ